jgi:hypothetical protein
MPSFDDSKLAFCCSPHPNMPKLELSQAEIADIAGPEKETLNVAYTRPADHDNRREQYRAETGKEFVRRLLALNHAIDGRMLPVLHLHPAPRRATLIGSVTRL